MPVLRHRGSIGLLVLLLLTVMAPSAFPQGTGKKGFQVAATDEATRQAVIAKSRARKGQFDAFKDRNADGIFDQVSVPTVGDLPVDINIAEAQGFTYTPSGDSTRRVVFYPAREARIPRDNEFLCFGFVHYFDDNQLSSWFACVVYKVPDDAKVEAQGTKKLSPYKADFIDRAGNRVGTPALLLLNTSAIGSNPDFQRWQKADNEVVLGYNPVAENRELFIFRKMPQIPDKVMMIFFRWF